MTAQIHDLADLRRRQRAARGELYDWDEPRPDDWLTPPPPPPPPAPALRHTHRRVPHRRPGALLWLFAVLAMLALAAALLGLASAWTQLAALARFIAGA